MEGFDKGRAQETYWDSEKKLAEELCAKLNSIDEQPDVIPKRSIQSFGVTVVILLYQTGRRGCMIRAGDEGGEPFDKEVLVARGQDKSVRSERDLKEAFDDLKVKDENRGGSSGGSQGRRGREEAHGRRESTRSAALLCFFLASQTLTAANLASASSALLSTGWDLEFPFHWRLFGGQHRPLNQRPSPPPRSSSLFKFSRPSPFSGPSAQRSSQ